MTKLEKAINPLEYWFAVLGSMAVQGPVTGWVADHRKHHAHTDEEGDPHSPHVGHGGGMRGVLAGYLASGSLAGAATGLLWGGLVRIFFVHHVTWSVNSICHFLGSRRLRHGRSLHQRLLAGPPSLGESWHHNHHAFPRSASHGSRRWELDPSALVISLLEKFGLAHNVVRISHERQAERTA